MGVISSDALRVMVKASREFTGTWICSDSDVRLQSYGQWQSFGSIQRAAEFLNRRESMWRQP